MEDQLALFKSATRWHALIKRQAYADSWGLVLTPIGQPGVKTYDGLTWLELTDVLECELGVILP